MPFKFISVLSLTLISWVPAFTQVKVYTFKECMDRAVEYNITLSQERLNNESDQIILRQSQYSRTPTLNLSGTQGFSTGRIVDPFSNQFVNQSIKSNNFSLSGSVVLFNGFQNVNTIKQNRIMYEAGKMDVEMVKNNVIINLASSYLSVLLAYEQVDIAHNQVNVTEAQVARTQELVNSGKVAELDLFKISAQVETDRLNLVTAENQVVLSKLSLAQIMNISASDSFEVEKIPIDVAPQYLIMKTEEIYNTAADIQPVVRSAALLKSSSEVGLKVSRGAFMPRLTLNGNITTGYSSARTLNFNTTGLQTQTIGYLQNDPSQLVLGAVPYSTTTRDKYPFGRQLNDNIGGSAVFSLVVPILNGRQTRSNIERSKLNIRSAELNEQSVKVKLRNDIEQVHADMKAAYKKYEAALRQSDALDKSYTGTELRYSLGMTNPTDLIIEKNNFVRGQSTLLQAKYEYLFNAKVLDLYVGKEITF
jgi:outer membrane protein